MCVCVQYSRLELHHELDNAHAMTANIISVEPRRTRARELQGRNVAGMTSEEPVERMTVPLCKEIRSTINTVRSYVDTHTHRSEKRFAQVLTLLKLHAKVVPAGVTVCTCTEQAS